MARRDDSIIAIKEGFLIKCKKRGSVFFESPQGACLNFTGEFISSFLEMLKTDEQFKNNFYTKELNYMATTNDSSRPDRTSIGMLEGYEIIKTSDMGNVFVREPMGAYLSVPISVLEYSWGLMNSDEYKDLFY